MGLVVIGSPPPPLGGGPPPSGPPVISTTPGGPPPSGPPVVPTTPGGNPPPGGPPPVGTPTPPSGFDRFEKLLPTIGPITAASVIKNAGLGALYGGVLSVVTNAFSATRGEQSTAQAVGNVIGDTFTAALGGIGFGISGNVAMRFLSGSMGLAGLPLVIGSVAAGTLGAVVTHQLLGGVKKSIAKGVASGLGYQEKPTWIPVTPHNFEQVMRKLKLKGA